MGRADNRPLQLVFDDVIHARHLFGHQVGVAGVVFQLGLDHGQRGFQTVREIGQGIVIALALVFLGDQQLVQVAHQAVQLPGIFTLHPLRLAALYLFQTGGQLPQGPQSPAQQPQQQ